jgi:hypothetical protein
MERGRAISTAAYHSLHVKLEDRNLPLEVARCGRVLDGEKIQAERRQLANEKRELVKVPSLS